MRDTARHAITRQRRGNEGSAPRNRCAGALKLDDIVERCELVTPANIRRTVGARRDTPAAELYQIAAACGVPWSWFEVGEWTTAPHAEVHELRFGEGTLDQRVIVLETYVAVMAKALAMQGIALESLPRSGTRQPTPQELLHGAGS
jgi:hypothetical protein